MRATYRESVQTEVSLCVQSIVSHQVQLNAARAESDRLELRQMVPRIQKLLKVSMDLLLCALGLNTALQCLKGIESLSV